MKAVRFIVWLQFRCKTGAKQTSFTWAESRNEKNSSKNIFIFHFNILSRKPEKNRIICHSYTAVCLLKLLSSGEYKTSEKMTDLYRKKDSFEAFYVVTVFKKCWFEENQLNGFRNGSMAKKWTENIIFILVGSPEHAVKSQQTWVKRPTSPGCFIWQKHK